MKKLLIPAMLLAAASAYGALLPATGGQLIDYNKWFGPEFKVASDASYYTDPFPAALPNGAPVAFSDDNREWLGWSKNWPTGLVGPLAGTEKGLVVEALFLGETAGWWDDWGYRLNGVDYLLADGVQAVGDETRSFGDYTSFKLFEGDTLDFFVTGSGIYSQDGEITFDGTQGGKYYVFDKTLNTPASATKQSYFGTLIPLTSVRGPAFLGDEDGTIPFSVMAFEDINIPSWRSDRDFNDFLFAFRSDENLPTPGPTVPEPSTYGLLGAVALLVLAGYRRFKKA